MLRIYDPPTTPRPPAPPAQRPKGGRSMIKKYKKKPVIIEAEQYVEYGRLVQGMCNSMSCYRAGNDKPHVHTIHNGQIVNLEIGDYVVPEPDGIHYYPVKADIFENTYELVEE